MRAWPGSPHPLGATWDGDGVNFAVFSEHATGVQLCLFDGSPEPVETIDLAESTDRVWHAYLPDARPGCQYGYRIDGPFAPEHGHRFNPSKLLIDPYAKAVNGPVRWSSVLFDEQVPGRPGDVVANHRDSAPHVPRSLVVDQAFTWGDDRRPRTPWNRTVIYECHVRGMTVRHPGVPEDVRGTFRGMSSDAVIDHLLSLGVTAVELMPVHQFVPEHHLVQRGLTNYWGYNSIAFFAPHAAYATEADGRQVSEFKSMVKTLHRAGIEVILDVVYNHTAEGNQWGPTLSHRGADNSVYYRLDPDDPRANVDFTGTGNTLDLGHPRTMALVMDSLRYWATDMRVDGFRFDLAPVLIRGIEQHRSAFFEVIQQDPVLSEVKLIAEPWDVGPDGYRLGAFPRGWAEWNGAFRDTVRRFWRGDPGQVPELASRLTGSSDIFSASGRTTYASVNFVTCHDGFTLHDLVSYESKHNKANGEDNGDGIDENFSRNWGEEGPTLSLRIERLRGRVKRNMLATVFLSQGVRMLLAGDEFGRTQQGNNNAYCQDNEVSWVSWDVEETDRELADFTRQLTAIVRANPVLRRREYFSGEMRSDGTRDVTWLRADGGPMDEADWRDPELRTLGMLLLGRATDDIDERGRILYGDTLLVLFNGGARARLQTLPDMAASGQWEQILDTARPGHRVVRSPTVNLTAHSLVLLRYDERFAATARRPAST